MFDILITFIFGTIVGSFINAVLWRIHTSQSIVRGRSKCVHCEHELSVGDLIPLLSFFLLRGRCRYCKKKISWQYPLVELSTGLLFVLSYLTFLERVPAGIVQVFFLGEHGIDLLLLARLFLFIGILLVLFFYDARWMLLPDVVTMPAIPIAFIINLFVFTSSPSCQESTFACMAAVPWVSMIIAALVGGGFFAAQYWVSKGAWIGGGDIRLGLLMGVMLGLPAILAALFIAYIVGSIVAIALLVLKKGGMKTAIPFGPFLVGATIVMLLCGDRLLGIFQTWYGL